MIKSDLYSLDTKPESTVSTKLLKTDDPLFAEKIVGGLDCRMSDTVKIDTDYHLRMTVEITFKHGDDKLWFGAVMFYTVGTYEGKAFDEFLSTDQVNCVRELLINTVELIEKLFYQTTAGWKFPVLDRPYLESAARDLLLSNS